MAGNIPVHKPDKPKGGSSGNGGNGNGGGGDTSTSTGAGAGSGGVSGAEARMLAREEKAKKEAAERLIEQAQTLGKQAKAWRYALSSEGFKAALKVRLRDINQALRTQDADLLRGYRDRVGSLKESASDNEKATSGQTYANLINASRERGNALSEAMLQGAGESDVLRAQGMSLRNWNANQSEILRADADTKTSINSALTDLTTDTRAARINAVMEAQADKTMQWDSYYDQVSEAQIQLGNTYGQMADYYSMADEQVSSKKSRKRQRKLANQSGDAFMDAAESAGKAWDAPGVSRRLRRWDGAKPVTTDLNNRQFGRQDVSLDRPEGATLRSWT